MTLYTHLRTLPRAVRWLLFPLFFALAFADLRRVTYFHSAVRVAAWSAWLDVMQPTKEVKP